MNPNSFDEEVKDAQANPETQTQGTEPETTEEKPIEEAEPTIDYRNKFAESAKEAQRLYEENKRLQQELEAKGTAPETEQTPGDLYPGFEQLDPEAQANLVAYTDMLTKRTIDNVYKDPSIAFARKQYNESKFNQAFNEVLGKYPDLNESKDEFKNKYFNPQNTPDNIGEILEDMAKVHLYDKARDIGAKEEQKKANRIDLERSTGGDKTPTSTRSLEDWQRMAMENPANFAKMAKEYEADLASGRLKQ